MQRADSGHQCVIRPVAHQNSSPDFVKRVSEERKDAQEYQQIFFRGSKHLYINEAPRKSNQASSAHPYPQITIKAFKARGQRRSRNPCTFISEAPAPSHRGLHKLFSFDTAAPAQPEIFLCIYFR